VKYAKKHCPKLTLKLLSFHDFGATHCRKLTVQIGVLQQTEATFSLDTTNSIEESAYLGHLYPLILQQPYGLLSTNYAFGLVFLHETHQTSSPKLPNTQSGLASRSDKPFPFVAN